MSPFWILEENVAKCICKKCGECCKSFEVFLADNDENRIRRALIEKVVVDELGIGFSRIDGVSVKIYGICTYLGEARNRCKIHKDRPVRCREFYCRRAKEDEKRKA